MSGLERTIKYQLFDTRDGVAPVVSTALSAILGPTPPNISRIIIAANPVNTARISLGGPSMLTFGSGITLGIGVSSPALDCSPDELYIMREGVPAQNFTALLFVFA